MQKRTAHIGRWSILVKRGLQLLTPVVLLLICLRLVLVSAGAWVPLEYRTPGFPEDRYGFGLQDRIAWSSVDIEFLLNDAEISYFDSFRLEDGSPMHNERELRHMQDVKRLIRYAWWATGAGIIAVVVLFTALWRSPRPETALEALARGARNTFYLMGILLVGIVFGFGIVFVGFHQIFFEAGTWRFLYSDTFIRLYPERFWRDTFLLLLFTTVLLATLVYWGVSSVGRRATSSQEASLNRG